MLKNSDDSTNIQHLPAIIDFFNLWSVLYSSDNLTFSLNYENETYTVLEKLEDKKYFQGNFHETVGFLNEGIWYKFSEIGKYSKFWGIDLDNVKNRYKQSWN